jgi:hypothetical protein
MSNAPTLKVPAGMRTTVLAGAEEIAFRMVVAVTLPPKSVLQAAVVQLVHEPLGMSPTTPAVDQSTARLGEMTPAHCWACPELGNIKANINAREHRSSQADLMFIFVSPDEYGKERCPSVREPNSQLR